MAILLKIFGLMFGIGALTFGGGYAIVGVLQNYIVDKLHWMTMGEFNTGIVVGQVTPGPLSTMVAFLGYKLSGVPGSLIATVGLLLPSFICSVLVAKAYQKVKNAPWVPAITKGLSLAVVALLVGAVISLIPSSLVDPWTILIGVATFFITGPWKKDPVWPFIGAAVVGILLYR